MDGHYLLRHYLLKHFPLLKSARPPIEIVMIPGVRTWNSSALKQKPKAQCHCTAGQPPPSPSHGVPNGGLCDSGKPKGDKSPRQMDYRTFSYSIGPCPSNNMVRSCSLRTSHLFLFVPVLVSSFQVLINGLLWPRPHFNTWLDTQDLDWYPAWSLASTTINTWPTHWLVQTDPSQLLQKSMGIFLSWEYIIASHERFFFKVYPLSPFRN